MDEIKILANNLKRIRAEKGLSLGQLADLCGVSKMLLSQIERANSNPTLTTIWKIAKGLEVPYTTLLEDGGEKASVLHRSSLPYAEEDDGDFRNFTYYGFNEECPFDWFAVEMEPGASREHEHTAGAKEYVYIEQGNATLKTNDQEIILLEGDSFCFDAACPHRYTNSGTRLLKFITLITYQK